MPAEKRSRKRISSLLQSKMDKLKASIAAVVLFPLLVLFTAKIADLLNLVGGPAAMFFGILFYLFLIGSVFSYFFMMFYLITREGYKKPFFDWFFASLLFLVYYLMIMFTVPGLKRFLFEGHPNLGGAMVIGVILLMIIIGIVETIIVVARFRKKSK